MNKKWNLGVRGILAFGMVSLLMFTGGCGSDNNSPSQTTSTGSITADTTGTVAAGTTVSPPSTSTSMAFASNSILTDASGVPVTGAIATTVTRSTTTGSLPAAAPDGTSLAVFLDIDMSKGTTKVKNFSTPMTVTVSVPSGTTTVDVYSFNSTTASWVLEHAGVAVSGGIVTFNITHLSVWACFSKITATPTPAPTATPTPTPTPTPTAAPTPTPTAPPAIDGAALYSADCASCHGALATSTKRTRTALQIQTAINNNVGGMLNGSPPAAQSLSTLTPAQVAAIAAALL